MRRRRSSEERIIGVSKEPEAGMTPSDLCRTHGISGTTRKAGIWVVTYYARRKKFAGPMPSER